MSLIKRAMANQRFVRLESQPGVIPSLNSDQRTQFLIMARAMERRLLRTISESVDYLVRAQKIPGLEKKVNEAFCLSVLRRQYTFLDQDHLSQLEALMSDTDPQAVAIMASSLRSYNLNMVRRIQSLISEAQKLGVETLIKRDQEMYGDYALPGEDLRDPKVIIRKMAYELVIAEHIKENPTKYLFTVKINGEEKQLDATEYSSYLETLDPSERKELGNLYKAYIKGLAPALVASFKEQSVDIIITASEDTLNSCYTKALKNLAAAAKRSNKQVNSGFIFKPYLGDVKGAITKPDDEFVATIDERSMASAGISREPDESEPPLSLTTFSEKLKEFAQRFEGVDPFAEPRDEAQSPMQSVFFSYGKKAQATETPESQAIETPESQATERKKPGPGRGYDDAT